MIFNPSMPSNEIGRSDEMWFLVACWEDHSFFCEEFLLKFQVSSLAVDRKGKKC